MNFPKSKQHVLEKASIWTQSFILQLSAEYTLYRVRIESTLSWTGLGITQRREEAWGRSWWPGEKLRETYLAEQNSTVMVSPHLVRDCIWVSYTFSDDLILIKLGLPYTQPPPLSYPQAPVQRREDEKNCSVKLTRSPNFPDFLKSSRHCKAFPITEDSPTAMVDNSASYTCSEHTNVRKTQQWMSSSAHFDCS